MENFSILGQNLIGPNNFTISNENIGNMNWLLTEDCDWLKVNPMNGFAHESKVALSIDANNLETGICNSFLTVSNINAENNPQYVEVILYKNAFKMLSPRGGEVWAGGSIHNILWDNLNLNEETVNILFSKNGGETWRVIASDIPNSGRFLWNVSEITDSNNCFIRVVPSGMVSGSFIILEERFTIKPVNPDVGIESQWQSRGKNFRRDSLSESNGPQFGCVKWIFDTNGPVETGIAVGYDGMIYAACIDGFLYAIESNGSLLWKYDTNTPLKSSPTIGKIGTIYVGGENGNLYAVDKYGNLRWTLQTGAAISASPAVAKDGKVFVASMDGSLYALGPDGSELWTFQTAGLGRRVSGSILASPAIDANGIVYITGLYDPNLYALDPNTGDIKWAKNMRAGWPVDETAFEGSSVSPVIGPDGTIYIISYELYRPPPYPPSIPGMHSLCAIEPNRGSVKWLANLADPKSSFFGPEFSSSIKLSSSTSPPTRRGIWYKSESFSEPVLGPDGTIYVSFDDPLLRAIEPNGHIKWATRLGMMGGFSMAVGNNGLIYAAGDDGYLCVVDSNGKELSRFISEDMLSFPVITEDNTLILSDANNRIWKIQSEDCGNGRLELHGIADLSGDGIVNFNDWAIYAQDWLSWTDRGLTTDYYYIKGASNDNFPHKLSGS